MQVRAAVRGAVAGGVHLPGQLDLSCVDHAVYDESWKQLVCKVTSAEYPLVELGPVFEAAYRQLAGQPT